MVLPMICLVLAFTSAQAVAADEATVAVESTAAPLSLAPDGPAAPETPEPQTPATPTGKDSKAPAAPRDPDRLHVDIYPIFGWVPFFSSNFTIPPLPNGGGGGSIGGSTNVKFTGAMAFAVGVTYKKLFFEGEGMFANVSAGRSTPYTNVSTHLSYGDGFVGWDVWKGLSPMAGYRRISVDFTATVLNSPTFNRHPTLWDPLVGVEFRKQLKHKINVQARFDVGGFGVGSKVDLDTQFRVEWRFAKHFGVVGGYQILYDKLTGTINQTILNTTVIYPWEYAQTFHGPILGFGIYF